MRICVFGASGRTGSQIVAAGLLAGNEVAAFVRSRTAYSDNHGNLTVVRGEVFDEARAREAIEASDVVMCAIGHSVDSPVDLCSRVSNVIVEQMELIGVKRILCITGALVGHGNLSCWHRCFRKLLPPYPRALLEDRQLQEKILQESNLEWTILRPPRLTNGPARRAYRYGESLFLHPFSRISRADLADFMVAHAADESLHRKAVTICY